MKRKIVGGALVLTTSLGWMGYASAQDEPSAQIDKNSVATEATEAEQETMSTSESKISGTVGFVDLRNHSVQVKEESVGITTVVVRSDTKIRRNGKLVALSDLKKGDLVAIKNPS